MKNQRTKVFQLRLTSDELLNQKELSWAGSNLNQSVKRANELAVAGLLSPGYVNEVLLPSIQDVQNILKRIKDDLETLNNRTRLIK